MKKNKHSRKKVRRNSIKKLCVFLLSISMISANSIVGFAAEDENISTATVQKTESNNDKITFAKKSQTVEIGNFQAITFDNIDQDDIEEVSFDISDKNKLKIYKVIEYEEDEEDEEDIIITKYIPEAKVNSGQVTVGATITKTNGDKVSVEPTTFVIKQQQDSEIVPIKSYGLYKALYDEGYYSADKNKNGKIEKSELMNIKNIDLSTYRDFDLNIGNEELNLLKNATECKEINLAGDKNITNIDFVANMNQLTGLDLSNTNIKTLGNALSLRKNELKYLNLDGTNVPFKERLTYLKDQISLEECTTYKRATLAGLFGNTDPNVSINQEDDSIISTAWKNVEHGRALSVSAEHGTAGKSVDLVISDGTESKSIKVNITGKSQDSPGFMNNSVTESIGHFARIETKNKCKLQSVRTENKNIVTVKESWSDEENKDIFYLEPHAVGTTKIIGYFKKNDVTYKDTMEITIKEADNNIIPMKSYYAYISMYDENENSVDANKDMQIDKTEILNTRKIQAYRSEVENPHLTNKDIEGWEQAVNCKSIDIEGCEEIKDINFVKDFKQLEEVKLSYSGVTDISVLNAIKNQITNMCLSGTNIPASQRYQYINTKEIKVEEGGKLASPISLSGVITENDRVYVADQEVAEYNEESTPSGYEYVLTAKGKVGDQTTLIIENGDTKKEIPIKIIKKADDAVKFAQKNYTVKQYAFKKIPVKNLQDGDECHIIQIYDSDDTYEILGLSNYNDQYYFKPWKTGTVRIKGNFQKADGRIYEDTMTVTVIKANQDDSIIPIKNFDIYYGLEDASGKSVDKNEDGQISRDELKNVEGMYFGYAAVTNEDMKLLEDATNCKEIDLQYNYIDNLDFIDKMKNLQSINLSENHKITDFSKLRTIKDQLLYLNLNGCKISDEERLSFLRTQEITVGAGNEITNPLMPEGIINSNDTVTVEDSNIAGVDAWWTDDDEEMFIMIKGKEGQEGKKTNLVITTEDGYVKKIPIKIVEKSIVNPPVVNPSQPTIPEQSKPSESVLETPKPTSALQSQKVEKITITAPSNKLFVGKKVKLTANISNNASNKNIKWTTSNKKYATVDKNGVVKFNKKAAGKTVTITAYATDGSGKKATFKIKIMKGSVQKITVSGKKTVKAGKKLSLKAKVKASKGANKKLKWISSNTKYAIVSTSGKVKALKAGKGKKVKITAMATDGSGKKKSVTVKIK